MGDSAKTLSPGDRWRPVADVLNGWQHAADYVRDLQSGGGAMPADALSAYTRGCVVPVKNNSGEYRNRFDVLGIDIPIFSPSDNLEVYAAKMGLRGVLPLVPNHVGRIAILLRPLDVGDTGPGLISGVAPCRVVNNVGAASASVCNWADIEHQNAGNLVVRSGGPIRVLWRDTVSSDPKLSLVHLSAGPIIRRMELKTDLALPSNREQPAENSSSATAYDLHWTGSQYDVDVDSGTFTVYDFQRRFRSKGRDTVVSGRTGARGQAIWQFDRKVWEVLHVQEAARVIKGKTPTGASPTVTRNMTTFTLTFEAVCDEGQSPLGSGQTTLTVTNPGFCFDSDKTVYCEWDTSIPGYRAYEGPCPANPTGCS